MEKNATIGWISYMSGEESLVKIIVVVTGRLACEGLTMFLVKFQDWHILPTTIRWKFYSQKKIVGLTYLQT